MRGNRKENLATARGRKPQNTQGLVQSEAVAYEQTLFIPRASHDEVLNLGTILQRHMNIYLGALQLPS
jgi:hypothetical protein